MPVRNSNKTYFAGYFAVFSRLMLYFFVLVSAPLVRAQLPAFTLQVTKTEETCPGNASLTCTTTGTDPAATVVFRIYLLPDTATPIAVLTTTNVLNGLASGNYRVVATQSLGGASNTQTQDVQISDQTVALAYTATSTNVSCNDNGTLTVNVFSGTGVSYEIISGPVTKPLQNTPFFDGLAPGQYQIRVFDSCGQGWVITHTVVQSTGTVLSWLESEPATLVDCDHIALTYTLSPDQTNTLSFPISMAFTIHPPGGAAPIIQSATLTTGDAMGQEFTAIFPYYGNQVYEYDLVVTDACGDVYYFANNFVNKDFLVQLRSAPAECGEYFLTFLLQHYMAPVTINFTSFPAGFDPVAFNAGHPGPFSSATVSYGNDSNGVPYGHYEAIVSEGCGHTKTVSIDIEFTPPTPVPDFLPHDGCASNISDVTIKISGYIINSAIIQSGPAAYSTSYPIDVSANITPTVGNLVIPDMNAGTYMILLTDTCGNIYNYELVVTDPGTPLSTLMWRGCEAGFGSVRISSSIISLLSVRILSAPADYGVSLPQDVSFNINPTAPGTFSMNGFPEGTYEFEILDSCNYVRTMTIDVVGYVPTTDDTYTIIPHCGSFDLGVHFPIPSVASTLWLQRYDPVTNTWGHPQTGVVYNPGDTPDNSNSYRLVQLEGINYNISYLGDFRIIHRFQIFENGSVGLFRTCTEIVHEFTFLNELVITDIQKTTCNGINSDVSITATGVPPLTYQITSMNGNTGFTVNNGNNNVFANLQPAVYNFRVYDSCGNITNELTDVALLPSLVQIHQPGDLVGCDPDNDQKANFDLDAQSVAVLGGADANDFNISYHLSAADAATGANPLPLSYDSVSDEIFVRMQYKNIPTCFDTASFFVTVSDAPVMTLPLTQTICDGQNITITADPGFETYQWSTGETTPQITVSQTGTYQLEVTLTQNGLTCTYHYAVDVIASQPALVDHIETIDWTAEDNSITVVLDQAGTGNYSFSLDNEHFQASNTFAGLPAGIYTVYIKDSNGCDGVAQQVYLLSYPKFFTPNSDGYNDFWQVFYARQEPNLKVYIFDRYGKLLTGFGSDSPGWDGRYNNQNMPSTDYWFLVIRQDGTQHRGHFAMKR